MPSSRASSATLAVDSASAADSFTAAQSSATYTRRGRCAGARVT
jgi:hypothetical protein